MSQPASPASMAVEPEYTATRMGQSTSLFREGWNGMMGRLGQLPCGRSQIPNLCFRWNSVASLIRLTNSPSMN